LAPGGIDRDFVAIGLELRRAVPLCEPGHVSHFGWSVASTALPSACLESKRFTTAKLLAEKQQLPDRLQESLARERSDRTPSGGD
jgi:hypothetical protein